MPGYPGFVYPYVSLDGREVPVTLEGIFGVAQKPKLSTTLTDAAILGFEFNTGPDLRVFLRICDPIDSGVAGRKLTAETVADAIKETNIEEKVKHRKLIIPGKAARISGEIEGLSNWQVLVGPRDSSGIPKFLKDKWK